MYQLAASCTFPSAFRSSAARLPHAPPQLLPVLSLVHQLRVCGRSSQINCFVHQAFPPPDDHAIVWTVGPPRAPPLFFFHGHVHLRHPGTICDKSRSTGPKIGKPDQPNRALSRASKRLGTTGVSILPRTWQSQNEKPVGARDDYDWKLIVRMSAA